MEEASLGRHHGGGIVEEAPWRRHHGGGLMEVVSWRRHRGGHRGGGISWRRHRGGGIMEEASWRRPHGIMEEASWGGIMEDAGITWLASYRGALGASGEIPRLAKPRRVSQDDLRDMAS